MKKKKLPFLLLLLFTTVIHGQDKKPLSISVNAGISSIYGEATEFDFIRESASDYYDDYYDYDYYDYSYASSINNLITVYNAGITLEKEIVNKLSFISGISYSRIVSQMGSKEASSNDYFFLLYSVSGTTTEFLKANGIIQNNDFIGIPIEAKYYTSHHFVCFFVKLGGIMNYRINTNTDIVFSNSAMEQYEDVMAEKIKPADRFNAFVYGGAGLRIGRDDSPSVSVEIHNPILAVNPDSFSFIKPEYGMGLQVSFTIPLNNKK